MLPFLPVEIFVSMEVIPGIGEQVGQQLQKPKAINPIIELIFHRLKMMVTI